ncbi:MAG: CopG family transcriptional regulator [Clostridiales bacterium]|nr:CopG family transcriptional regulator [Clostridiales bacterium]
MTISIRLSESDSALIRKYAEMNKITISDLVRQTLLERIEEEYDIAEYEEAMKEYLDNPKTYSLDEVEKELGLV